MKNYFLGFDMYTKGQENASDKKTSSQMISFELQEMLQNTEVQPNLQDGVLCNNT